MYSTDQGPQGVACAVSLAAGMAKISVPSIGGEYQGKLDSDTSQRKIPFRDWDHPHPIEGTPGKDKTPAGFLQRG